jgi:hypothetical protein
MSMLLISLLQLMLNGNKYMPDGLMEDGIEIDRQGDRDFA